MYWQPHCQASLSLLQFVVSGARVSLCPEHKHSHTSPLSWPPSVYQPLTSLSKGCFCFLLLILVAANISNLSFHFGWFLSKSQQCLYWNDLWGYWDLKRIPPAPAKSNGNICVSKKYTCQKIKYCYVLPCHELSSHFGFFDQHYLRTHKTCSQLPRYRSNDATMNPHYVLENYLYSCHSRYELFDKM
jgi:hypothetical protein